MAFVTATWASNDCRISLNVDNIVAVSENDGKAVVHTVIPKKDGYAQFWLTDSYESFLNKLALTTGS